MGSQLLGASPFACALRSIFAHRTTHAKILSYIRKRSLCNKIEDQSQISFYYLVSRISLKGLVCKRCAIMIHTECE
jgi:hypothetical protein